MSGTLAMKTHKSNTFFLFMVSGFPTHFQVMVT